MKQIQINEKGGALIVALVFVVILSALGLSLLLNSQIDHVVSSNSSKTSRATFAAQTGIERMKAWLFYDYQNDIDGWKNRYIAVPDGTPGATDGAAGLCGTSIAATEDCFDLGAPSETNMLPFDVPHIPQDGGGESDTYQSSIWPAENPAVGSRPAWGTYGYQIMLRHMSDTGALTPSATKICVISTGFTDESKGYFGLNSRGTNMVEQCITGDDISIWNNIVFVGSGGASGMGNMKIHGNVHLVGAPCGADGDPQCDDPTVLVLIRGNQGWYNDYVSGLALSTTNLDDLMDPEEAAKTRLDAKLRIRNGVVNFQNVSAEIANATYPYDAHFGCENCGTDHIYAVEDLSPQPQQIFADIQGDYDVPDELLDKIEVPNLDNAYIDPQAEVAYPAYRSFLVGYRTDGTTTYNLPGVLALKLATAYDNNDTDEQLVFDNVDNSNNNLAWYVLNAMIDDDLTFDTNYLENLFDVNAQNPVPIAPNTTANTEQQILEDRESDAAYGDWENAVLNPTIAVPPTVDDESAFMVVASDPDQNVVVVYKEIQPFTRSVDRDLGNAGTAQDTDFPRQVHGFVYTREGYIPANVRLRIDVDGNDRDGNGDNWGNELFDHKLVGNADVTPCVGVGSNHCYRLLNATDSMKVIRKAVNALWNASKGPCLQSTTTSCWNAEIYNGSDNLVPNDGTMFDHTLATDADAFEISEDGTATGDLDNGIARLIGYGVIQLTDDVWFNTEVEYTGRMTLLVDDTAGSSTLPDNGLVNIDHGPRPINSYTHTISTASIYSFPCDNNLGIMADNEIQLGDAGNTHDEYVGAFFAATEIDIQKQIYILGAVVSTGYAAAGGGNPDWFQSMQMSKCLPPYMIGGDPIILLSSQSYNER